MNSLFGREGELQRLTAVLNRAQPGGLLLIRGPAGIGKTALLDRAKATALETGYHVLEGAAHPESRDVPHFPLRIALAPLLEPADGVRAVAPEHLPWWTAESDGAEAAAALADEAICAMLRRLAERQPVLLLVDDLQWADRSTLRVLRWMSRALRESPVTRILAFRDDEGFLTPDVATLSEPGNTLWLRPLEEIESRRLFASAVPPGFDLSLDAATWSVQRAGGNPLFLIHAARAIAEGHEPHAFDGATGLLQARFMALPTEVRDALAAAAVLGSPVDLGDLAELTRTRTEALGPVLRQAVEAGFLKAQPGRDLRFSHPLARAVAEESRLAGEAVAAHAAALRIKQARWCLPEELAIHAYRAGDFRACARLSLQAARLAATRGASHEAAAHYDRAIDCFTALGTPPDPALIEEAARTWVAAGDAARAARAFLEVADRFGAAGEQAAEATAVARSARALATPGTLSRLEACIAACEALDPAPALALALATWAHAQAGGRSTGGRAVFSASERALAIARTTGDSEALATALLAHGHILANAINFEHGCALLRECLDLAGRSGLAREEHAAAVNLASLLTKAGRFQEAGELARSAAERALRRGAYRQAGQLFGRCSEALLAGGQWAEARRTAEDALLLSDDGDPQAVRAARFALATCLVRAHAWAEAEPLIQREIHGDEEWTFFPHGPCLGLETQRMLAIGDITAAVELGKTVQALWLASREAYYGIQLCESYVAALVAAGRPRDAQEAVAIAEKRLVWLPQQLRGVPSLSLSMQHGILAAAAGRHATAVSHLDDAVAGFAALAMPYEEARASRALAQAAIESNDASLRPRARTALERAHRLLAQLGSPEAEEVHALLRRMRWLSGGRREKDTLTPREREIAHLVAAGLSNREIATQLVLSARTVDNHLARMFDKFEVRTRTALVRRLTGHLAPAGPAKVR